MATNPFDQFDAGPGFTGVIPGVPKAPPVPSGYEPDPVKPGGLRPIPGGPDDPATNDTLDDNTTTFYAQQILAGAPMPAMGMGKTASQNRQKVMKKVAEIAGGQGLSGGDLAKQIAHYQSGKKQLGTLEQQLGTTRQNETTALLNGQQFLDRSAELPGQTEYPALNAITQFFQKNIPVPGHDTKVAMDQAYQTFVNEYAKVVAGSPSGAGVLSDSARHEAMEALKGNYSMSQKKAVFDQMKADMENRMIAMKGGINQGYDALVKQPGYEVPDDTSHLSVAQQKQQDHIMIPGVSPAGGGGSGGDGGDGPPGVSQLSPEQQSAEKAFRATNPTPEQYASFLTGVLGKQVTVESAKARLDAAAKGAAYNPGVEDTTEQQKVKDRIATEDKLGLNESPATTLLKQGATLNLSDEAAGVGNAAANVLTSPFTGKFDPVGSYQIGRDTERQRIADAQDQLGAGGTAIQFVGGMASAAPTNALAAVSGIRELMAQGAKGGAVGGALAGFGAGQGASQSITGAGIGAAGGATVGALAPYAAGKLAARGLPKGMAPDLADAAQAEGVDLIRPMVDPASRGKFGALESAPGSQNIIREGIDKTKTQIESRVGDLAKGGVALDTDAAGGIVQNAARRFIQRSKGVADTLYNRARSLSGDATVTPRVALLQLRQELMSLKETPGVNQGQIDFLNKLGDDLTQGPLSVNAVRGLRTGIRDRINESGLTATQADARASRVLDALQQDVTSSLPPAAATAYRRADAFYRERMNHVDDIISRFLGPRDNPVSGEQAFTRLKTMASPGGDARRLSGLMRDLDPSERQDIAATIASRLGRRSQDEPFSTDLLLSQTNKLTPSAQNVLFGPDGAKSIANLRLLSQKLKEGGGDINRSKTANSILRQMATKFVGSLVGIGGSVGMLEGGMAGGGTGVATGLIAGGAVKAAGMARNALSARAMVNPRVSQWLAQAANVSTPSQAQQAVKGLSLVISREPALAHELTPIRDFLDQRVGELLAAKPTAPDQKDDQQR